MLPPETLVHSDACLKHDVSLVSLLLINTGSWLVSCVYLTNLIYGSFLPFILRLFWIKFVDFNHVLYASFDCFDRSTIDNKFGQIVEER